MVSTIIIKECAESQEVILACLFVDVTAYFLLIIIGFSIISYFYKVKKDDGDETSSSDDGDLNAKTN